MTNFKFLLDLTNSCIARPATQRSGTPLCQWRKGTGLKSRLNLEMKLVVKNVEEKFLRYQITFKIVFNSFKGGGVLGQKFRGHDFEITCDPKGPQRGPTFWSGFLAPDP